MLVLVDPVLFTVPFKLHRYTKCITFGVGNQPGYVSDLSGGPDSVRRNTYRIPSRCVGRSASHKKKSPRGTASRSGPCGIGNRGAANQTNRPALI
jgi:hypothetical protein